MTIRRTRLIAAFVLALMTIAATPALAADAPAGQMTWALHFSLAPTLFEPAETPGVVSPFMILYALHDAMREADARARAWRRAWPSRGACRPTGSSTSSCCARARVPQRRARHRRGRQVLVRALPRHLGEDAQGQGRRGRDAGSRPRPLPAQAAVARLHDVLRHAGDGRELGRPQEVRREGRRGRLQEGAGRRRAVPLRLVHAGRRAGARGVRRLLAQDAEREAPGLQGGPGRGDAAGRCSSAATPTSRTR